MTKQVIKPKDGCKGIPFADIRKGDKVVMHRLNCDLVVMGTVHSIASNGQVLYFQQGGAGYNTANWDVKKITRRLPQIPTVDGLYMVGDRVFRVAAGEVKTTDLRSTYYARDDDVFTGPLLTPAEARKKAGSILRGMNYVSSAARVEQSSLDKWEGSGC